MTDNKPLIPLSEAAALLGESLETVRKRATRTGEVAPGVPVTRSRLGARRYVLRADLDTALTVSPPKRSVRRRTRTDDPLAF